MQIDFYLLKKYNSRERFVCHLIEKAYQQKYHCYIYCQHLVQAQQLDSLLWIYKDISFLPHAPYDKQDTTTPIQLAHPALEAPEWDDQQKTYLLINLHETTPLFFSQFNRVTEIVSQWDSGQLQKGRARYQQYSDLGHTPNKPYTING